MKNINSMDICPYGGCWPPKLLYIFQTKYIHKCVNYD